MPQAGVETSGLPCIASPKKIKYHWPFSYLRGVTGWIFFSLSQFLLPAIASLSGEAGGDGRTKEQ
jgi:hypothetical protein